MTSNAVAADPIPVVNNSSVDAFSLDMRRFCAPAGLDHSPRAVRKNLEMAGEWVVPWSLNKGTFARSTGSGHESGICSRVIPSEAA